jgi:hypothetical protein
MYTKESTERTQIQRGQNEKDFSHNSHGWKQLWMIVYKHNKETQIPSQGSQKSLK